MSDQHWGARPETMWWPNVGDQQAAALQQQQQQQQILLQHQQQQNDAAIAASTNSQTQQLFSYKMASSFEQPQALSTVSSSSPVAARGEYDYRLGGGNQQWWYPSGAMDMHSMPQQTMAAPAQNPSSPQQSEVQEAHRQQDIHRQQQEAVQRHQEAQRQQQEAVQRHHQQEAQHLQHQQELQHHQALIDAANRQRNQQHLQQQVLQQQQHQQHLQQPPPVHQPKGRMPRAKADARPRGRMTAYAFFVQTCREEHKKKHPEENVVFAEFSRKCAERWKTMIDKEKKRFHEMAEGDKKRYDAEMQNYTPPKGEKQRGKKRKQVKDPNAPKRSLSAFFWFSNDERGKVKAQNPEYGVGDIAKELGRRWADCTPEAKGKFEALADQDKARYEKEMTAYKKKTNPALQPQAAPVPVPEPEEDEDEEDIDDEEDD